MRLTFIFSILSCILVACNSNPSVVTTHSSQSGEVVSSEIKEVSGGVQEPLTETLSGNVNDFYPIFEGLETKVIHAYHISGTPTKVSFINHDAQSMSVTLDFLQSMNPNLRLSRIIMPDGTMDGPFGVKTGYNLPQKGGYELIFNENQMAGEPWSGALDISISLSGAQYPENTVIFE